MRDMQRLFVHLPQEVQVKLRSAMHVQTFEPGEPIFHQGSQASGIYAVIHGRVKITRVTPDGYESILCVRQTGEYFCPVPVLDGKPQLGTAVAMGEVTVLWVECQEFHALCREHPQLLSTVQRDCLAEVRYLLNRLETFAFRAIRERLAIALLDEARHQRAEGNKPIVLKMSQQELGGLIGASRESVSRSLKRLEREGIVEIGRGKVRILNQEKLSQIANIR